VENKRINVVFYLVVTFFFAVFAILITDLNAKRALEYKEYAVSITHIVKQKNDKIRFLFRLLMAKERENEDLKNTLAETRNDLDALSKKLAQPVPAPVPAGAPAPAAAAK
jgi:hypothetical protein